MAAVTARKMGYDEDFLDGYTIAIPTPSAELSSEILFDADLRDGYILDYEKYSVVMNADPQKRSAAVVAFMFDQEKFKQTKRARRWQLDSRIGYDDQLDNDYYINNPWDRGHLARRSTAGWGDTRTEAQRSANSTFFYTNAALQHCCLNQDEWLALENSAKEWDMDSDGKILSFNGCIYGDYDRTIQPQGRDIVRIPSAFFKVLAYKNKKGQLECRAFIVEQDSFSMKDKNASSQPSFDSMTYQVSLMEVEVQTGLVFDEQLYEANPLKYNAPDPDNSLNIVHTPERIEVFNPSDVIGHGDTRQTVKDDIVDIFITLLNLSEQEPALTLMNMGTQPIDISGWFVLSGKGKQFAVPAVTLNCGESVNILLTGYDPKDNSMLVLKDSHDARIDWVHYEPTGLNTDIIRFVTPARLLE
ncbi:DNA/RNA non-specific endonuclease [Vibrio salinus]|uniref:DNA/RNA non-specific endonuclease n=1 Tax=Vibrio salinus TaxID=2899784 RepID=UPI001E3D018B|nr:DNA/RNA non-specific endonuclease [Vibrio salinus]MCE0496109.1 DNA/RNA non-specific endonuclease [Vibrio salinus]